jgi:serine/threonine protein kinase
MSMNMSQNKTHVSGVRHGTPLYISPEILRNGKASKAADVFSFGVIMWEMMHGTLAWNQLLQVSRGRGEGKGEMQTHALLLSREISSVKFKPPLCLVSGGWRTCCWQERKRGKAVHLSAWPLHLR